MKRNLQRLIVLVLGTIFAGLEAHYSIAASPKRTTAVYDDWTVICVAAAEGKTQCEIVSTQTMAGQNSAFSQISVSHPDKAGPYKAVIQSPPNAWLQTGMKLVVGGKDEIALANFKWCASTRCLSEGELSSAQLKKLAAATQPASLDFKDAAQNEVSVPVSLNGFGPALEMMDSH